MLNRFITGVAALALAVSFVAAGLGVCCAPAATEVLARMYAGSTNPATPFSHEELVQAAMAGRDYTVGSHDKAQLYQAIRDVNAQAQEAGRAGEGALDLAAWDAAAVEAAAAGGAAGSSNAAIALVAQQEALLDAASESYVLPSDAVSHLDDVNAVIRVASVELALVALIGAGCLVFLGVRAGKRRVGGVLMGAGIGVLALFAALGVWAAADFYGFFAVFHSLFFASGTWTFASDSLLITMYPTPFWVGMGVVWLAVTGILCVLAVLVGRALRRRAARR